MKYFTTKIVDGKEVRTYVDADMIGVECDDGNEFEILHLPKKNYGTPCIRVHNTNGNDIVIKHDAFPNFAYIFGLRNKIQLSSTFYGETDEGN